MHADPHPLADVGTSDAPADAPALEVTTPWSVEAATSRDDLVGAIRSSLCAKMERLLRRPLVARIGRVPDAEPDAVAPSTLPEIFRLAQLAARASAPTAGVRRAEAAWREEEDGTASVRIVIDYDDLWRGAEKEVLETVTGTVESAVAFLTDEQRALLERSPREFLALRPRPESAELVTFRTEPVGGADRVVELTVAEPPRSGPAARHVAIVPNLIPLERQLDALRVLAASPEDGPLAPLRALVGLDATSPTPSDADARPWTPPAGVRLDEFQADCVRKALTTPHFAVIKGPPGSGKTTVITSLVRHTLEAGGKVLVVSPTHVAVDNVVEKLVAPLHPGAPDDLGPSTLPVRYAARPKRLLDGAAGYWIGPRKQRRAATIAGRLEDVLSAASPVAREAFHRVDEDLAGHAPLSAAIASVQGVICGTPIGILSFDPVKHALPGAFDLLVVDEVSKMTLPEFLAVAVKARRWVLVGDPDQLPPFNHAEENGTTLDPVLPPLLELACSVGAILERVPPANRQHVRLVVASREPTRAADVIREHLRAVKLFDVPQVVAHDDGALGGITVCPPAEVWEVADRISPARGSDLSRDPHHRGSVEVLVERGLRVARPPLASGRRLVEPRQRGPAALFENAFTVYHTQPWAVRAAHKLRLVSFRNGLEKVLPSVPAIRAAAPGLTVDAAYTVHRALLDAIAVRFAVNTVSVFDWLAGIPTDHFDTAPLEDLTRVAAPLAPLRAAVHPYVGTLKKQYRMHASLSLVPRELFYFGDALIDGRRDAAPGCRAVLVQVTPKGPQGESNPAEADEILRILGDLDAAPHDAERAPTILVITPYREQERVLRARVDAAHADGRLARLDVEVCTLDRCQGREADYVFVSLVRSRATTFLDAPKRWNVALTRAMQGLFLVGDVDTYLEEARVERREATGPRGDGRPRMSLLARILEAYDHQIHGAPVPTSRRNRN